MNKTPKSAMGRPRKKRKRTSIPKLILKLSITTVLVLILLFVAAASAWVAWYVVKMSKDLPTIEEIIAKQNSEPTLIYDRNGEVIARLFLENRTSLRLDQVSPWLIRAILAAEDSSFYQHAGIKITSMVRALWMDVVARGAIQGASTITQQLARNLFLSQEKSITRKAKEIILAMRMEKLFTKDKILEMYLNTINFGRGAWGVETAARTYFGCSALDIDLAQAAILAGLIPAPGRYNPLTNLENAKNRQNYVLSRMESLGWIDENQRQNAYAEKLVFKHTPNRIEEFNRAPYFVSHILFNELLPRYGTEKVYSGGLQVHTTLDISLDEAAQQAVLSLRQQGALVCLASDTGEVLALVGGKDFKESKFNRATQAFRQPGSSFKPVVYAAALENDIMPFDHFMDAEIIFNRGGANRTSWSPKNSDGKYHGEVTVIKALSSSYNTVAVRTAAYIGTQPVVDMARSAGITSEYLPNDLSVALGSASVTPLEMAVVFNCFSNGGKRIPPIMIQRIDDRDGTLLASWDPQPVQAMKPETAYTLRSMLYDVIRAGTGGRAKLPKTEVFGKTGTSNDFIDAWFIGGAPGLTTAVYTGNDNHKTMGRNQTGGIAAAPAWKQFMEFAVQHMQSPEKFTPPPSWVEVAPVTICRTTGFRATGQCPAVPLYIPAGKAPKAQCPTHGGSYSAAAEDPNAPRLFLVEQDGDIENYENTENYEHPMQTPAYQENTPAPETPPYHRDPSPAEIIEERYQQLLKQYGIE
ncbi:MAG: PBP1A family penicillin-binding protein [Synergistaceae bacterium]|jgi:penicillin-binding protein 1A|nr:PBP1A family penicillin-binding protein [Synergistaceae bacterium]